MRFRETKVYNFEGAIRGMRNPLKSWEKSDSFFTTKEVNDKICGVPESEGYTIVEYNASFDSNFCEYMAIGPKDMALMQNLIKGGSEHAKFLRQIVVSVDITAPRYFWSEFDTYHFNTKNSESTMHKLLTSKEPITRDNFEKVGEYGDINAALEVAIEALEILKADYNKPNLLQEDKDRILRQAKAILPEGFLQKRTITTNYAELANIYKQRRKHRLPEWKIYFVNWIKSLPLGKELICFPFYN